MPSTLEKLQNEYATFDNQLLKEHPDEVTYYEEKVEWRLRKAKEMAERIDTLELQVGLGNPDTAPYFIRIRELEDALSEINELVMYGVGGSCRLTK